MKVILGKKLFDLQEVADLLGLSRNSVPKYIKESNCKETVISRKHYLEEAEIKKLLLPRQSLVLVKPDKVEQAKEILEGISRLKDEVIRYLPKAEKDGFVSHVIYQIEDLGNKAENVIHCGRTPRSFYLTPNK